MKCQLSLIVLLLCLNQLGFGQNSTFQKNAKIVYDSLSKSSHPLPDFELFLKAYSGFEVLKKKSELNKNVLTIIDFRLSSNKKRMWVIDFDKKAVIFHNLVAHGRNSGEEYAKSFSNVPMSKKSSLGFYTTGNTYFGKHGLSLYLHGMEKGFNHEAKSRSIVMHGAEYVSLTFSRKHGRLGRSFGCPAVPVKIHKEIITTIKNKSCLFIYYPDAKYLKNSTLLNAVK